MRAFDAAIKRPWAITEEGLQQVLEIAARTREERKATDLEAVAAKIGRPLQNAQEATIRDGVAILEVSGPIFRYANLFTYLSGATSVELLAQDFRTALENPQVKATLLHLSSPGGEVEGISEFAGHIFEARGVKPVVAYAAGDCCSAAYWIASAADEIVCSDTAILGSIGVVAAYRRGKDDSRIEFVSTQSPHKRPDLETDDGRAQIQRMIDGIADVFVETVARNRGVSAETVLAEFGQGGVFVGQGAVDAGLADRTGSFEETLATLAGTVPGAGKRNTGAQGSAIHAQAGEEKDTMPSLWDKIKAGLTAAGVKVEDEAPEPTADTAPAQPEAAAPPAADPRIAQLEAQLAAVAKDSAGAKAAGFADALIAANKALPGEREDLVAAYVEAAQDDAVHPLAEGSRVEKLQARCDKRPPHVLTEELVAGDQPEGAVVLPVKETTATQDPEAPKGPMTESRRRELLGKSEQGRRVLKTAEKK